MSKRIAAAAAQQRLDLDAPSPSRGAPIEAPQVQESLF